MNSQKVELDPHTMQLVEQMLGKSLMSGSNVRARSELFLAMIVEKLNTDGVHCATEFAQKLVQLNPNLVDSLHRVYAIIKNERGSSSLGKAIALIHSKIKREQMEGLTDIFRTPPLHTTGWMLKRLGELVDQTAGVVRATQLGLLKYKPVLLLEDKKQLANQAFLPYLDDVFEIISDPKDADAFKSQATVPKLDTFFMHFNDDIFGHASEYEAPLTQLFEKQGWLSPAFQLKNKTSSVAQNFLQQRGLKNDDLFVTLHVREFGYFDATSAETRHAGRNSPTHAFQESVDYLIRQGVKVVRIGHAKMTPMKEQPGFIDLSCIDRPSEVDIYLCAKNWFYFGSSSGPLSLAYQFGRPSLLIDFFPHGMARPNCLHLAKRLLCGKDQRVLSFQEIERMDLQTVFSARVFKDKNILFADTPSEDITSVVKDMVRVGPENVLYRNVDSTNLDDFFEIKQFKILFSKRSTNV